jgi:hypothetical protein
MKQTLAKVFGEDEYRGKRTHVPDFEALGTGARYNTGNWFLLQGFVGTRVAGEKLKVLL